MRIELVEKLVFMVAILAIIAVGAIVALFTVIQRDSGISKTVVDSELATMDWLEAQRARRSGKAAPRVTEFIDLPPEPRARGTKKGAAKKAPESPQQVKKEYYAKGNIPRAEQVPGVPWLRRIPGVRYAKPKPVPQVLYQKYQSFKDTWELVQEGGGEFVQAGSGETAYQVNWVNDNSYLYTRLGLRPGDRVISVNGQPIGQSVSAGKAMYDQLKGEKRYAVLVERNGQQMVLSYFVK